MNRLDALKYFVHAAETLNFRATANHFAVSPQVISRMIAELEADVGEQLFKRNTRSIQLTEFGDDFLPKAIHFLQQESELFHTHSADHQALSGTVRITLPPSVHSDKILAQLLQGLANYPNIAIDWRTSFTALKEVDDKINIGIRISQLPHENWVVKKIGELDEPIVASSQLIARTGLPKDIEDLITNFPVGSVLNPKTDKPWNWFYNNQSLLIPNPTFIASDPRSLLVAVRAGRIFAPITREDCDVYLKNGELQSVLDIGNSPNWSVYLYRPYQTITPKRVQIVFEILERILNNSLS